MNFSTVDFTPCQGKDKSPNDEIVLVQGLQDFSSNNAIAPEQADMEEVQ